MVRESLNRVIFLSVLFLLVGCGEGPERTVLRGGTEHLPLLDSRVMRYREKIGAEERTYTMQMRYAGGKLVRVYPLLFKGLDLGHCMFRSNGPQVLFSTDKPLTAMMALPEYRQLWVDETAKAGDEWEDKDVGTKTTLEGFETITVAAGTYEKCYKTVTTVEPAFMDSLDSWRERGSMTPDEYDDWAKDAHDRTVRWFASGVGLVKEDVNNGERVRELVAVVKPGTGRVDIDSTKSE
jgi:hypothetical protein